LSKVTLSARWIALLALTILAISQYTTSQAMPPAKATVTARLEYGYGLVFYSLELQNPVTYISFNLSGFTDKLVLGLARPPSQSPVVGVKDGDILSFKFQTPVSRVNFTFVFNVINTTDQKMEFSLPVPLSPLGYATNVTGVASFASGVTLNSTLGKVTGSQVNYNLMASPSSLDIVKGEAPIYQIPVGQIAGLNRTILIEPGRFVFLDSIEILALSNYPISTLSLNLPKGYTFDGASGVLGPYPATYWRTYNHSDSTLVVLNLMSSVQMRGQRTTLTLRYHVNQSSSINAFLGWGATVTNYRVKVCIRGTLKLPAELIAEESFENEVHCYSLKPIGPLFLPDTYPSIPITGISLQQQSPGYTALLFVILIAAVGGGIYALARLQHRPVEKAKKEVLKRTALPRELLEKLQRNLSRREELLLSTLEHLRGLRERRAGTARITSAIREYEKRDSSLETEVARILGQLGDEGRRIAAELQSVSALIREKLSELERTERDYRVGRLEKKEYQERVERIDSELRKLSQKFREISDRLS